MYNAFKYTYVYICMDVCNVWNVCTYVCMYLNFYCQNVHIVIYACIFKIYKCILYVSLCVYKYIFVHGNKYV